MEEKAQGSRAGGWARLQGGSALGHQGHWHLSMQSGAVLWRVSQGCILSPCLFNLYVEYIMRNTGLEEAQAGIKSAGRNINNLRYTDDNTLMEESEEELKILLMKVKEESEKVGLNLNIMNMLSRLVITFLPRSKRLLISWLQSLSAVILEPPKIKSDTVSTVSPSIFHEVMGPDAMIFVF